MHEEERNKQIKTAIRILKTKGEGMHGQAGFDTATIKEQVYQILRQGTGPAAV